MISPYLAEQIENWAGGFPLSDAARGFPEEAESHAPGVLSAFLKAACERAGGDLAAVGAEHLQPALLSDLAKLAIPESVRPHVPGMIQAFLGELEREGRLAGGRALGANVAAAAPAYLSAASGKGETYRHPGSRLGRNDPCPCGSGKKYKKCCGA